MRKVHEQVTEASHDIMEMDDKNKNYNTTTTSATMTSHTSKSNEVKIIINQWHFADYLISKL